jgi:hypothetical protein
MVQIVHVVVVVNYGVDFSGDPIFVVVGDLDLHLDYAQSIK